MAQFSVGCWQAYFIDCWRLLAPHHLDFSTGCLSVLTIRQLPSPRAKLAMCGQLTQDSRQHPTSGLSPWDGRLQVGVWREREISALGVSFDFEQGCASQTPSKHPLSDSGGHEPAQCQLPRKRSEWAEGRGSWGEASWAPSCLIQTSIPLYA